MLLEFQGTQSQLAKATGLIPRRVFIDPAEVVAIQEFDHADKSGSLAIVQLRTEPVGIPILDDDKNAASRINAVLEVLK